MTIGLSLTQSCNFQCKHCLVNSTLKLEKADDKVIERFYEIVKYNKPEKICLVGGEPLLFIDTVEKIVNDLKPICNNFLIFSNGTFLLDENKRERVKNLGVEVRISKTDFHKVSWDDKIQKLIDESPYLKIEGIGKDINIFPRGRALTNKIYKLEPSTCSLITNEYNKYYHNNRILIMQDGTVNIWCPCLALELANVFEDEIITHDLLVEREQKLRKYLIENKLLINDMLFMCNEICDTYKVTKDGIYKKDILVKSFNK